MKGFSPRPYVGTKRPMSDESVDILGSKIRFSSVFKTSPLPPKQCWFFYFLDSTDYSAYTTLNLGEGGGGGVRELTLHANKIEQVL